MSRHGLFERSGPISVARAPGRFDVLGGIADYSGSLVLGLSTEAAAFVAAQVTTDGRATAVSGRRRAALPVDELADLPIETLARRLSGPDGWAAYVLGPIALLLRELGARPAGIRVLVSSTVPEGKGLGSSAAVAVATLRCRVRRPSEGTSRSRASCSSPSGQSTWSRAHRAASWTR